MKYYLLLLMLLIGAFVFAAKPENPVKINLIPAEKAHANESATLRLHIEIQKGWHIFSEHPEIQGVTATHIELEPSDAFIVEKIEFPKPVPTHSDVFQKTLGFYTSSVDAQIQIKIKAGTSGDVPIKGTLQYQSCSDQLCMPPAKLPFSATQPIE